MNLGIRCTACCTTWNRSLTPGSAVCQVGSRTITTLPATQTATKISQWKDPQITIRNDQCSAQKSTDIIPDSEASGSRNSRPERLEPLIPQSTIQTRGPKWMKTCRVRRIFFQYLANPGRFQNPARKNPANTCRFRNPDVDRFDNLSREGSVIGQLPIRSAFHLLDHRWMRETSRCRTMEPTAVCAKQRWPNDPTDGRSQDRPKGGQFVQSRIMRPTKYRSRGAAAECFVRRMGN